jgi:hypothetical protein
MVILTRIKFHTIFYASTSPLDKYCDVIIHVENFKNYVVLQDSIFPFRHEGHLNTGTAFSHSDMKGI